MRHIFRFVVCTLALITLVSVFVPPAVAGDKYWDYGSGTSDGPDNVVGHEPPNHSGYVDWAWLHRGADTFVGQLGNDNAFGHKGDDDLRGNEGRDFLVGGDGNDFLSGGDGDDLIEADEGMIDDITCGPGDDFLEADVFDKVNVSTCETIVWKEWVRVALKGRVR